MIVNALAGKPLPVYGDGQQVRDWLYVKDHCAAIRAVLAARPRRARPTTSAAGTRSPTSRSCARICALLDELRPDADGPLRAPDHATSPTARPRPALRDRRAQDRARARLAAGRDLRDRPAQDRASGTSTTPTGSQQRAERRLPRLGRDAATTHARAHEDPAARQERPGRLGAAARAGAARRAGRARLRQRRACAPTSPSPTRSPRRCARCGPT